MIANISAFIIYKSLLQTQCVNAFLINLKQPLSHDEITFVSFHVHKLLYEIYQEEQSEQP